MLDATSRRIVEMVKGARELRISILGRDDVDEGITIRFNSQRKSIKKLSHDIALAMQDYMNNQSR